jgi:iron complex transport system ATP-binding protein
MPLLAARGLHFDYPGPLHALRGLDLELERGELAIVIGPNGSGKSTLVRLLAGLLMPTRGAVTCDGRPLGELSTRERAFRIAVVPQFLPALPEVRVRDFVLSGRYARLSRWRAVSRADLAAVDAALDACDARELAQRSMTELSGGQRQRVLVARALAQEAQVLLIDEPTNALDPEHQLAVFECIARLRAEGERCALVVTHDLNLAGQYATRLLLLDQGRVAAQGPVERVLVPAVLGPVYGDQLYYGRFEPGPDGRAARPFVLPVRRA